MTILVLGGGWQQLPAIRKAREMGLRVIVADYLESAPGRKEADRFYLVSTRDREAILAIAESEAVDGVLAFASDPAELTAAYVAEECGLPGGPMEATEILGNKEKFRQFLSMHRLPVPGYFCFPDAFPTEAGEKRPGLRYPILIKPVDSSGSKGVTLLRSYDAVSLMKAYQKAIAHAFTGKALAEEEIVSGYRYVIGGDVIVRSGRILFLGLMDCLRAEEQRLVPCGKIYPCGAKDEIKGRIAEILSQVICDLHIADAEMNVEFIAGRDGVIYPVEIALRCGGNGIPQLLSDATGVDWIREEVSRSLRQMKNKEQCLNNIGIVPRSLSEEKEGVFVSYNLHTDRDGIYMGYYMEENLAGHCYRREMFRSRGEPVHPYQDASGIIGILYFYFANREEAENYLSQIRCCLVVHVAAIAEIWSRKSNRMGRFLMQSDLQENILRMGEYMRPAFTERERAGIDVRAYAKKLTDQAEIHVAVNEKEEIIGMIAAYLNRADYGFISMLVVAPEFRGCSIAKKLCRRIHEQAQRLGLRCVRGEIRKENTGCRRLAKSMGYEEGASGNTEFVSVEKRI